MSDQTLLQMLEAGIRKRARREALEEVETLVEDYEIGGRSAYEVRRDLAAAIRKLMEGGDE